MPNSANQHDMARAPRDVDCDCGRPRAPRSTACSACIWLDGATEAEALVIAALRVLGGTGTRDALSLEVDVSERTLWRALARLRDIGRVIVNHDGEHATYALRTS